MVRAATTVTTIGRATISKVMSSVGAKGIGAGWIILGSLYGVLLTDAVAGCMLSTQYRSMTYVIVLVAGCTAGALVGIVTEHCALQVHKRPIKNDPRSPTGSSPKSILGILWCILIQLTILHLITAPAVQG